MICAYNWDHFGLSILEVAMELDPNGSSYLPTAVWPFSMAEITLG